MRPFRYLSAALLLIVAVPVQAQYPEHAVHIVVPSSPGSSLDIIVRTLGDKPAKPDALPPSTKSNGA